MKSLSHCHALGIIEGMLFQIHDRVQTITWGFLLWRQCVISFTPARTGVITEGFAGEWGSWQHPALGLWWPEQRGEAGLCVFICSTLPSPQAAPHFPFLKSLFSLFCPGEHLTVFLPVRILLIYWYEAQPSSLLDALLVPPQLKGPPALHSEPAQHPLHLLSAWPHPSIAGCHWHLFASFSFSLWVLALDGRDYILLLTHLLTKSGPLSPPSLAQFCFSSISQVDSYSNSLLAGCSSLQFPCSISLCCTPPPNDLSKTHIC